MIFELSIEDTCIVKGGKRLPKGHQLLQSKTKHPYIRTRDLNDHKINVNEIEYITPETHKEIERYIVDKGNLIISIVGTVGSCAIIPDNLDKANLTENCAKIVPKDSSVDTNFLYYFLISKIGQNEIYKNTVGSTQLKLPLYGIKNIKIPSIDEKSQARIADFLSTLDKKIELNQKINETLEEIAKTLFKSWFIDFDPVRAKAEGRSTGLSKEISDLFPDSFEDSELGEIPKGWKASQVKDFCSVIQKGIAPKYTENQSYPVINQKCIRNLEINFDLCRFTEYKKVMEDRYLENFDILLNSMGTGTLGRSALFVEHHTKAVVDGCISVMRGKSKNFSLYVYQSISRREDEIINLSQGSTGQTTLKTEDIGNLNLIQPTNELIALFSKSVADLHLKKYSNSQENKVLSNLRDTLLPKLISGELKIPDAENLIKEKGI
tara:strand:- start:693 stop:2000 length:1308 start_codon:yes stop_codon:yes gene_type:complete